MREVEEGGGGKWRKVGGVEEREGGVEQGARRSHREAGAEVEARGGGEGENAEQPSPMHLAL